MRSANREIFETPQSLDFFQHREIKSMNTVTSREQESWDSSQTVHSDDRCIYSVSINSFAQAQFRYTITAEFGRV